MSVEYVIKAERLTKSFYQAGREIGVLAGIDLVVKSTDSVAILGVSGSGKSTLLHLLAGLDQADSGRVLLTGLDLNQLSERQRGTLRNQHVGFVYQFHHLLSDFDACENVAMPLMIGGENRKIALERAELMLQQVNLQHRLTHLPSALSGGERQRVAIARALVTNPSVVLADEPTGNLDRGSAKQVHELLLSLSEERGTALVVVTHDQLFAESMQQVHLLDGGNLEVK